MRSTGCFANIASPERYRAMTSIRPLHVLALALLAQATMADDAPPADTKETAGSKPANLIRNGGFEELNSRGKAAHWINSQHAGARAYDFRVDGEVARSDNRSLMIRRIRKQVWGKSEQLLPVGPEIAGKTVEFEVWARAEGLGDDGFRIRIGAFSGSMLVDHATVDGNAREGEWIRQAVRLEIPEHATRLFAGVTLEDEGTIWIDDARLGVVDASD